MTGERTLVMLKPDAIERGLVSAIFAELDETAGNVGAKRTMTVRVDGQSVTIERLEQHYAGAIRKHGEALRKDYLPYFKGKPLVLAVYEGPSGTVRAIKDKVGPTDPLNAPKNSIRGKYGRDSLEQALRENRAVENLVHASDPDNYQELLEEFEAWIDIIGQ
jgi:nucleoside-diphosphate kinase